MFKPEQARSVVQARRLKWKMFTIYVYNCQVQSFA